MYAKLNTVYLYVIRRCIGCYKIYDKPNVIAVKIAPEIIITYNRKLPERS